MSAICVKTAMEKITANSAGNLVANNFRCKLIAKCTFKNSLLHVFNVKFFIAIFLLHVYSKNDCNNAFFLQRKILSPKYYQKILPCFFFISYRIIMYCY